MKFKILSAKKRYRGINIFASILPELIQSKYLKIGIVL